MKQMNFWGMMAMLLCAVVMGFSSCSDDDESDFSSSALVGTWEGVTVDWCYKQNGVVVDEEDEGEGEDISDERWKFNADGTALQGYKYSGADSWEWDDEPCQWKLEGNKLIIMDDPAGGIDDWEESATIKELSANRLVVELHDKYTDDGVVYEDYERQVYRRVND